MRFEFTVRCSTPLFTKGGDGSLLLKEGLRASELRGALHFWFRAAAGAYLAISDLRKEEGDVFGDVTQGRIMRVTTYPPENIELVEAYPRMNDSNIMRSINRIVKRKAIPSDVNFRVVVESFRKISAQDAKWIMSLWMLCNLGGVGGRTRRGFGSLEITDEIITDADWEAMHGCSDGKPVFHYPALSESLDQSKQENELKNYLEENMKHVMSWSGVRASSNPTNNFSVLAKGVTRIFIVKPLDKFWPTWDQTMDGLRNKFYRFFKKCTRITRIGGKECASPMHIQIKSFEIEETQSRCYFGVVILFLHDKANTYIPSGSIDTFLLELNRNQIKAIEVTPW